MKKRKRQYARQIGMILKVLLPIGSIAFLICILERGNVINILPEMKTGSETKESERIGGILIDDISGLSQEGWDALQEYLNSPSYNEEDLPGFLESFLSRYPASVREAENAAQDEIRKRIEVSYQEQKLYYYEDEELIFTSDIVTGNETTDIIPYGTYHVLHMTTDATLVGPDYEKHVDYWIGFDEETGGHLVGFHDASWRTVFGGDEWRINPTLECINMPADKVRQLYEAVQLGTEILIHD